MNSEERNKLTLVMVIVLMLVGVIGIYIYLLISEHNDSTEARIILAQIYSSDYDLKILDDDYFVGMYDNEMHCIINREGKEIYKTDEGILDPAWYKLEDGRYLIYSSNNDKLNIYIFDGENLNLTRSYEIDSAIKPIIYNNNDDFYIVGLMSNEDNKFILYDIFEDNIYSFDNYVLIGDYIEDNVYYTYNANSLIVMKDSLLGAVDLKGNIIIDAKYNNLINSFNNTYIAYDGKRYGIIDDFDNICLKFNYNVISSLNNGYLVVNNKNKMAIYESSFNNVSGFVMNYNNLQDYNIREDNNSFNTYEFNNNIVVINNYKENLNNVEYSKHDMYVINDNKIIGDVNEINFGHNDNLSFSYDKDYNVNIYNEYMTIINSFRVDNVKYISDMYYINDKIVMDVTLNNDEKTRICYDKDYNESSCYPYGDLVYYSDDYYVFLSNDELTVIDKDDNVIINKSGNISVNNNYIIVDNDIYELKES